MGKEMNDRVVNEARKRCIKEAGIPKHIKEKYDFEIRNGKLVLLRKRRV